MLDEIKWRLRTLGAASCSCYIFKENEEVGGRERPSDFCQTLLVSSKVRAMLFVDFNIGNQIIVLRLDGGKYWLPDRGIVICAFMQLDMARP